MELEFEPFILSAEGYSYTVKSVRLWLFHTSSGIPQFNLDVEVNEGFVFELSDYVGESYYYDKPIDTLEEEDVVFIKNWGPFQDVAFQLEEAGIGVVGDPVYVSASSNPWVYKLHLNPDTIAKAVEDE